MASSLIHIAVTNELNKKLNKNKEKLFIGTIAPDISKLVGENKMRSHFLDQNDSIPNLEKFLDKYKENLNDDFVLGYYIHLYTDFLWFKYFISEVYDKDIIRKLDGTEVKCNGKNLATGTGSTKKQAEMEAARKVLEEGKSICQKNI